eukprot:3744780-Pyramimonas_sp.AAC.1
MDGRIVKKSSAIFQRKIKLFAPKVVSMHDINLLIALSGRTVRRVRLPHVGGRRRSRFAEEVGRGWARPIMLILK